MGQTHDGAIKIAAKKSGFTIEEYRSRTAIGEKWCYVCRAFHPISNFGKDSTRFDGLASACSNSKYKRVNLLRPGINERRTKRNHGFKWCRGCLDWLPSAQVCGSGVCRTHANEEYRNHYASGGKVAIAKRTYKRSRGVDQVSDRLAELLTDTFGGLCAYCPRPATTWDHIIPVSIGGQTQLGNIVPACRSCNSKKKDRPVDVMPRIGHLLVNEIVMAEVV